MSRASADWGGELKESIFRRKRNKGLVGRWFTILGKTCTNRNRLDSRGAGMLLQYSLHEPRKGRTTQAFITDFAKHPHPEFVVRRSHAEGSSGR